MTIICRVTTPDGRYRLELDPQVETLATLKERIAARCSNLGEAERASMVLTTDPKGREMLSGDHRTLWDLGLRVSGIEIHTFYRNRPSGSNTVKPAKSSEPALPKPKSTASISSSSAGLTSTQTTGKKKYETFETYIDSIEYETSSLPLSKKYEPIIKRAGCPTPLPPTLTLKNQPYRHVDHIEVANVQEMSEFVSHWRSDLDMLEQRAALLIGYYKTDPHYGVNGTRAVVEGLYEPPQISSADRVTLMLDDDPNLPIVERVAAAMGLEIVGWMFTRLPREQLVAPNEVLQMAQLQLRFIHNNHYTRYPVTTFVTLTISPKESLGGEPGSDAFMVSDQGLAMVRDKLLEEDSEDPVHRHLRLRKAHPNELMPTLLESSQQKERIDADWFLVRLNESAPKQNGPRLLKRSSFPRVNRYVASFVDLKEFMTDPKYKTWQPWEAKSDFNFLVWLGITLGVESAERMCAAIMKKEDVDPEFNQLLISLCSS